MIDLDSIRKIAIISESFPPYGGGGIDAANYNLFQKLKDNGYNVKVFTFQDVVKGADSEDVKRSGPGNFEIWLTRLSIVFLHKIRRVVLKRKDKGRTAYQLYSVVLSNLGALRINKYIRRFKPDILIVPDHGVPFYVIKKPINSKVIHFSHHNSIRFLGDPIIGFQNEWDILASVNIERKSLRKVDLVICPSYYMKEVFIRTFGNAKSIRVIPNIISEKTIFDINKHDIRENLGLSEDALLIYIPSACSNLKGSIFLFEILRRLFKNVKNEIGFYLSGGTNEVLEFQLRFLPESRRIYRPEHLSYSDNISLIKACDLCITPTLIESFGMAILEANFCSIPVIAFDVGGVSDILNSGINGILIRYFDIEVLIEAACELLDNKDRLKALKQSTFTYACDKFNSDKTLDLFIDAIKAMN